MLAAATAGFILFFLPDRFITSVTVTALTAPPTTWQIGS